MKKLSKRERIMLFVMGIVVIIGITILIARPLQKKVNEVENNNADMQMQLELLQMTVADTQYQEDMLQAEKDRYATLQGTLRGPISADSVEQIVLEHVSNCNLKPVATILQDAAPVAVSPQTEDAYVYEEDYEENYEENYDESYDEGMDENVDSDVPQSDGDVELDNGLALASQENSKYMTYYYSSVSLTLEGTMQNMMAFLDICKDEKEIIVENFTVMGEDALQWQNYEEENQYYLELSFYMMPEYDGEW